MKVKSVKQPTCKQNIKDISFYIKSSTFIEILIETNDDTETSISSDSIKVSTNELMIPKSIKMNILSHILYLNNMTQIISK